MEWKTRYNKAFCNCLKIYVSKFITKLILRNMIGVNQMKVLTNLTNRSYLLIFWVRNTLHSPNFWKFSFNKISYLTNRYSRYHETHSNRIRLYYIYKKNPSWIHVLLITKYINGKEYNLEYHILKNQIIISNI